MEFPLYNFCESSGPCGQGIYVTTDLEKCLAEPTKSILVVKTPVNADKGIDFTTDLEYTLLLDY